jgi:hypothetical protein
MRFLAISLLLTGCASHVIVTPPVAPIVPTPTPVKPVTPLPPDAVFITMTLTSLPNPYYGDPNCKVGMQCLINQQWFEATGRDIPVCGTGNTCRLLVTTGMVTASDTGDHK